MLKFYRITNDNLLGHLIAPNAKGTVLLLKVYNLVVGHADRSRPYRVI
jgi:hypothetical protein